MLPGGKLIKMSNKKTYIIVYGLMLLISTTLISTAVEITPEIIDIELVGGNFTSREITLSNTESYSVDCKVSTMIHPDGAGINITYSEPAFTISPHTIYSIEMRINTSIDLEPNSYLIETKLEFINQDEASGSSSDDSSIFHYVIASDDEEETPTDTGKSPPDENETILEYDNNIVIPSSNYPFLCFILPIVIIISSITLIMLLYVIRKKKQKKKKKEQEENREKEKEKENEKEVEENENKTK